MNLATYILDQVKGLHTGMTFTVNEIAAQPPVEVRFHSENEGIMHEYVLDNFIQIEHYGYDHSQDDDIKEIPPEN